MPHVGDSVAYTLHHGERVVGRESVWDSATVRWRCLEGRIEQWWPARSVLVWDALYVGGELDAFAADFEIEGITVRQEAWREGDRWRSRTEGLGRPIVRSWQHEPRLGVYPSTPIPWIRSGRPGIVMEIAPPSMLPRRRMVVDGAEETRIGPWTLRALGGEIQVWGEGWDSALSRTATVAPALGPGRCPPANALNQSS